MLDVLLKIKTDTVARNAVLQCLRGMNKYGSPTASLAGLVMAVSLASELSLFASR